MLFLAPPKSSDGKGLIGIRERVILLGGEFGVGFEDITSKGIKPFDILDTW